jgi:Pyridoxal-phosphate dependent enzyme
MTETRVVTPAALLNVWPCHAPTPLVDLPRLATRCGVARVVLKDEGLRPLGSFKALGGMYAGLRALARATGLPDIATLVAARRPCGSSSSRREAMTSAYNARERLNSSIASAGFPSW